MSSHSSTKVVIAAMVANLGIALAKFTASAVTGSAAMFSEAIHSVVDTVNQILLLVGIKRSNRPADASHPYGYHREIYIWAAIVAVALMLGGVVGVVHGIESINHPEPLAYLEWNIAIYVLAFLFEGGALWTAFKEFKKTRGDMAILEALRTSTDPALYVVIVEDTVALSGLVLAAVGTFASWFTGYTWIDGLTSVLIGLGLMASSVFIFMETLSLATGESAHQNVQEGIRKILETTPGVESINELLTEHKGPHNIHVDVSVDFNDFQNAGMVERTVSDVEKRIKLLFPHVSKVFMEIQAKAL